jgi:hypothetical protein
MAIIRRTLEEARKVPSKSDTERLKNMTDEEITKAAEDDPDNLPLTEEDFKRFKPAVHRGGGVYAHEKSDSSASKKPGRKD